jgi:hypothetical protein
VGRRFIPIAMPITNINIRIRLGYLYFVLVSVNPRHLNILLSSDNASPEVIFTVSVQESIYVWNKSTLKVTYFKGIPLENIPYIYDCTHLIPT